ncbi:MAG TPA: hypothetical protein PKW33_19995 [Anaerolineaceae bacterium]|nr:hypothetical protein [Anaerolineaceae bacterium]HPN53888.1 hypothetical protein [Anaerolineaceae bacterium]
MEEIANLENATVNIVADDQQALERAILKWVKFQQTMWVHITARLEGPSNTYNNWATTFRITIIILSAVITAISGIEGVPLVMITILSGVLTALTGVEAFLKFAERRAEMQRQQRELQAKRDDLRYQWMIEVELETDLDKRLKSAKRLLIEGPKAFNDILNKYAFKSKESDQAPTPT